MGRWHCASWKSVESPNLGRLRHSVPSAAHFNFMKGGCAHRLPQRPGIGGREASRMWKLERRNDHARPEEIGLV